MSINLPWILIYYSNRLVCQCISSRPTTTRDNPWNSASPRAHTLKKRLLQPYLRTSQPHQLSSPSLLNLQLIPGKRGWPPRSQTDHKPHTRGSPPVNRPILLIRYLWTKKSPATINMHRLLRHQDKPKTPTPTQSQPNRSSSLDHQRSILSPNQYHKPS